MQLIFDDDQPAGDPRDRRRLDRPRRQFAAILRDLSRLRRPDRLTRDGSLGPMGVKSIAAHLNARGVRTRDGGLWGKGPFANC